jgi:hypothetical protein
VLGTDEDLAGRMAGGKLQELNGMEVTALALVCPFCNVMFEGQQKTIAKKLETKLKVPVVYLTQVLGLALGLEPDQLGFKLNRVKPKDLIKAFKKERAGGGGGPARAKIGIWKPAGARRGRPGAREVRFAWKCKVTTFPTSSITTRITSGPGWRARWW